MNDHKCIFNLRNIDFGSDRSFQTNSREGLRRKGVFFVDRSTTRPTDCPSFPFRLCVCVAPPPPPPPPPPCRVGAVVAIDPPGGPPYGNGTWRKGARTAKA